jgi:hypothetical protein
MATHAAQHGHGGHDHGVDVWHHHERTEGEPQHEHLGNINPWAVSKWFAIAMAVLVFSIAGMMVYFDRYKADLNARIVEVSVNEEWVSLRTAQEAELGYSSTGAANRDQAFMGLEGGKVKLPIDAAMEKIVRRYEKK